MRKIIFTMVSAIIKTNINVQVSLNKPQTVNIYRTVKVLLWNIKLVSFFITQFRLKN